MQWCFHRLRLHHIYGHRNPCYAVEDDESNTAQKVEYVAREDATKYKTMSEAAMAAEEMAIVGFSVERY